MTARFRIYKDTTRNSRPWCLEDRLQGGVLYRRSTFAFIVHTMIRRSDDGDIGTLLPNLEHATIADLRRADDDPYRDNLTKQVATPRVNLGGSGPPGRAD